MLGRVGSTLVFGFAIAQPHAAYVHVVGSSLLSCVYTTSKIQNEIQNLVCYPALKCPTTSGVAVGRALSGRGVTPSWESRGGNPLAGNPLAAKLIPTVEVANDGCSFQ